MQLGHEQAPTIPPADHVTPGIIGFVATFLVAAVTVVLVFDMVRRVRRVRYTAEIRARLEKDVGESDSSDRRDVIDGVNDDQQDRRPVAKKRDDSE